MGTNKKIIYNVVALLGGTIGRKLLSFLYFAFIARIAGVPTAGLYYLMVSFAAFFTPLMDFGLSPTMTREASKSPHKLWSYLNNILGLKLIFCLAAGLTGALLISVMHYPDITQRLVYLVIVIMVLESFSESFYACLRVHYRMKYEAIGLVVGQLLTLIVGGIAIWQRWSIYALIAALLVNQAFNFGYSLSLLYTKLRLSPRFTFQLDSARVLVTIAAPFLVALIFEKILSLDTLLLSFMTNDQTVGIYSVPATIVSAFPFIPAALVNVIFPALSAFYAHTRDKVSHTFDHAYYYLLIFILPVALGMTVLARPLIRFLFGVGYSGSVAPLQWMAMTLVPMFLNILFGALLNACSRHMANMWLLGSSAALHLLVAVLLVPRYHVIGIAIAGVAGQLFLLLANVLVVRTIPGLTFRGYAMKHLRAGIATAAMSLVLAVLHGRCHVIGLVLVGMVIYSVALIIVQGVSWHGFSRERALAPWMGIMRNLPWQRPMSDECFANPRT